MNHTQTAALSLKEKTEIESLALEAEKHYHSLTSAEFLGRDKNEGLFFSVWDGRKYHVVSYTNHSWVRRISFTNDSLKNK